MTFEEVKQFINSEAGKTEEVKAYLQGINPYTVEGVQKFLVNDKDGKSWFDSERDKYAEKAKNTHLETFKEKELPKIINEAVSKANPELTPEQKRIKQLEDDFKKLENEKKYESIKNKALTEMTTKKLPVEIVEQLISSDLNEETTIANIGKFEKIFSDYTQRLVEERIQGTSKTPPSNSGGSGEVTLGSALQDYYNKK